MWKKIAAPLFFLCLSSCSHPAERALQGHWQGIEVENFSTDELASATGWARGTSLDFRGSRVTITAPEQSTRNASYRLAAIEQRRVTLDIVDADAARSELVLFVDDDQHLRWDLGDGRSLVLLKQ